MPLSRLLPLLLIAGLTACGPSTPDAAPDTSGEEVLAEVNGQAITTRDLQTYRASQPQAAQLPDEALLEEIITHELVYQEAERQRLAERDEVQRELAMMRRQVLINAAVEAQLEAEPVTEEDLQAAYEEIRPQLVQQQFHARHILVEERAQAEALIARLNDGADFAELAAEHSTDPGSAEQGGDLGWFVPEQMVPPFAEAVRALEPGQYTREPVESPFGWHVIHLEGTRQSEPPSLEQLRGELTQYVQQQQVQAFIERLRSDARIEVK